MQLYGIRDDVAEDESDGGHISEHLQVSEFSESILRAHQQNYSSAGYLALRRDSLESFECFDLDDFAEVLRPLEFVEVARVLVAGESTNDDKTSKLSNLLGTVLHPIADEWFCLFYETSGENDITFPIVDSDSDAASVFDGDTATHGEDTATLGDDDVRTEDGSLGFGSVELGVHVQRTVPAPIFVRFLIDDKPISTEELSKIERSSTLAALVSVFKTKDDTPTKNRKVDPSELHVSHQSAALELSSLMNAYVAEQNLERLRHHGSAIDERDVQFAKTCLRKAQHILSSTLEVFFYVPKIDSIVAASAPSGSNAEVEEGFNLLASELREVEVVRLRPYGVGDRFFVDAVEEANDALAYWCFVKISRALGSISVDIHHPGGGGLALEIMNTVLHSISMCCHHVNQLILLRSLHRSRTASRFLIPPEEPTATENKNGGSQEQLDNESSLFYDGLFCCPVVYRTPFELFHRCATNPTKVARALEASVLHIFALSNRRKSYVYKDESGAVFYMSLSIIEGVDETDALTGTETEAQIELVVFGIDKPGPSVTVQLKKLLQKKLLSIAVDMLSAVVTKNPQYHWRQNDISFVRSYDRAWSELENDDSTFDATDMIRTYAFPPSAYDPGMIILFFRQNICGSTFFHPLITTEWVAEARAETPAVAGANLHFGDTDLVLYFNTAPSKLDSNFQSESTLTRRGAEFSRQTGSGIAIIELSFVTRDGTCLSDLTAAIPTKLVDGSLEASPESLRFEDVSDDGLAAYPGDSQVFLQVRITDTALKRSVLHQWVKLSLDQVLTAWAVERQLERMQRNLFRPLSAIGPADFYGTELARKEEIEAICPGLPSLTGLLEYGEDIPHPAVLKLECTGVVRSSAVASVALELLERGVMDHLRSESKKFFIDNAAQICIIRSSRSTRPRRVTLEYDTQKNAVVRYVTEPKAESMVVKDSPIDCPEYTIFFHSADYMENRRDTGTKIPKLFEEVLIGFTTKNAGDTMELFKPLAAFKRQNRSHFRRSFAFIFSIKRNRRVLLAYNWNAKLFKSVTAWLKDKDASFLVSTGQSVASLQQRTLGTLAPPVGASYQRRPKLPDQKRTPLNRSRTLSAGDTTHKLDEEEIDRDQPTPLTRRVKRPQMIRRPKLVGQSVEGSAMQAVARSRARASATSRFRGAGAAQSSSSTTAASNVPRDDSNGGRGSAAGKISGAPRPPRPLENSVTQKPEDKKLRMVKKELETSLSKQGLLQQSSLRAAAYRTLTSSVWPIKSKQNISLSVAEFVFSNAPLAWFDVADMLPLPTHVLRSFLASFGQTICAWTPGLAKVPIQSTIPSENSFFLVGTKRNVRNSKCFVVIKLSTLTVRVDGKPKTIVTSEGRILSCPRRKRRAETTSRTQLWIENDGAGLNKLATETRELLFLQGALLDHAASIVERTMKSDGVLEYNEVLRLLIGLIDLYPLRPAIALRSNYKCYQATLVLRSYRDRFISLFDGPTLFKWLRTNLHHRKSLLDCGPSGLCFKREIIVRASHSICFLSCDDTSPLKMKVNILCRTQKMVRFENVALNLTATNRHHFMRCASHRFFTV